MVIAHSQEGNILSSTLNILFTDPLSEALESWRDLYLGMPPPYLMVSHAVWPLGDPESGL